MDLVMMESEEMKGGVVAWGVYEAAAAGNCGMARYLVGVLENGWGFNGMHLEVLNTEPDAVLFPYRKNQILKKATGNGSITPLQLAASNPNPHFLRLLYADLTPMDASEPDDRGRTALHFAAGNRDPGCLRFLLEEGMEPAKGDLLGVTPLMLAARYGRDENVRILVEALGADHTAMKEGFTPLHIAAHFGHASTLSLLLLLGASPTTQSRKTKATALHHICSQGHTALLATLLPAHLPLLTTPDKLGRTPLHLACKNGHTAIVKQLLRHGADPDACDTSDNTPLHYACGFGYQDVVELLVGYGGADPNRGNCWKFTGLMVADMKGHMGVVRVLLGMQGVRVDGRDKDGYTMLHRTVMTPISSAYESERMLEKTRALLEKGADPNVEDLEGATVMHMLAGCVCPDALVARPAPEDTEVDEADTGADETSVGGPVAGGDGGVDDSAMEIDAATDGQAGDGDAPLTDPEVEATMVSDKRVDNDAMEDDETEGKETEETAPDPFYIEDHTALREKQADLFLQYGNMPNFHTQRLRNGYQLSSFVSFSDRCQHRPPLQSERNPSVRSPQRPQPRLHPVPARAQSRPTGRDQQRRRQLHALFVERGG
ncbi:ankyrin repeat-containing domain protein [Fimicolochytrium jonesii]|uniref:ankyrin repeat-containing domain protein n=1 Tax=Fimicolochytrium jonesii TaxID=1396493 RepID=UPI0022FEEF05|nr:ankyrin repeat-containing domain protein [Fimicolochytrium jonesii]KAI8824808.1 ankyrin repeat-containing domain protein [Fimicolochytrium jonesii]